MTPPHLHEGADHASAGPLNLFKLAHRHAVATAILGELATADH
jgi:hypothetical protein